MASTQTETYENQTDATINALAKAFGVNPDQAATVIDYVTPKFTQALEELTLSRGGLADLLNVAGRHLNFQDSARTDEFDTAETRDEDNRLLGQMFGTKYKSRVVARRAAKRAGLETGLVKKMLPALANQYMGRISSNTRDPFARVNDSIRIDNKFEGQQPLEIPSSNIPELGGRTENPYGDLSDIIRRGGRSNDGGTSGGILWSIVRNILGSSLGFQSRGIMGWIIQMIVYRFGWSILKTIFRTVFAR